MWTYNQTDYLCHFGVQGMKWGVRKDDGKSSHRLKLEDKYKQKGLSSNEAEKKASDRIRVEKILAVTAGVTLAAAAVTIAHNEYAKNWTKTALDEGRILQRMTEDSSGGFSSKTFVSFTPKDNAHYAAFKGYTPDSKIYQVSLKSVNKITAPSNHTVNKLWAEAIKENAMQIKSNNNLNQFSNTLFSKDPEIRRASIGVVSRDSPLWKSFSNKLQAAGYNAVIDYTDAGGGADKPLILLNAISDVARIGSRLMP